ncbi:MAG TPA: PQQ-binding-like beta-propeller repeat protein [Chloroflexia bacterium]|nr:PQQ-binding-like beta-propeller repeat protein [Chloroflexia bacterium]
MDTLTHSLVGLRLMVLAGVLAPLVACGESPPPAGTPAPASTAAPAPTPQPGDWPMYGYDPARTGYSPAEQTLRADNVDRWVQRWQVNIGTNGTPAGGSPSVANGRVYVGSSVPTGPNFFALDAATGAQVWATNIGYVDQCGGGDQSNVGIGATPAIAGNIVVAGGGDAAYYGLDATTGARVWRHPLDVGPSGFAWESPLIAGSRTYIGVSSGCDNPSVRGEIRALDLASGKLLAAQAFVPEGKAGAGIWNSPALSPDGNLLALTTGEDYEGYEGPYNRAMVTLDPATLAIGQAHKVGGLGRDLDWASSPIIYRDGQGRTLAVANHKTGVIYAYDLSKVSAGPVWSRELGKAVGRPPVFDPSVGTGGTLVVAAGGGQIYALDPATGQDRWGPLRVNTRHGNMAVANGMVFVNMGTEGLMVADERSGAVLRIIIPPQVDITYSGAVVAHGILYWLSGSYLNAWSLPATP